MADDVQIRINDAELQVKLRNFVAHIGGRHLLAAAGEVMQDSIAQTFRDEGSPAGSWPPLAASTLKRVTPGHKMLIGRGRLARSIVYRVVGDEKLEIGSNLVYAAIHQLGGEAGRRGPFKKKGGRRAHIPARPYLVFRPEDPDNIRQAMERVIDQASEQSGLK
jgi:phage virion morphogenesis protein